MTYKPVGADEAGHFPPRVTAALNATYAPKIDGPVAPLTSIAAFGESTTESVGTNWPANILAGLLGVTVTNQGISGQGAADVLMRAGAFRPKVTLTGNAIPASGAVTITSIDPATGWRINGTGSFGFAGTIAGIAGSLAHDLVADTWSFTRTAPGSVTPVPAGTEFIPAPAYPTHRLLLGTGRNNVLDGSLGAAGDLVGLAPNSLTPQVKKYKIWGVINGTNEPSGNANYTAIKNYNARLAGEHGSKFYDVRRDFIDTGLAKVGLTATSADAANIAADCPPPSLMADTIHPNFAGYNALALLLATQLVKDGWAAAVSLPATLAAPVVTAGTATDVTQPLTWTAITGATAYKVEYRTNPAGAWTLSAGVVGTSHTVTGLSGSTAYDYRVSTVNLGGAGSPSSTVTSTTAPPATVLTSDSFNRADTTAGTLGTTDVAYGGTAKAWTTDSQVQILSNQVGATSLSTTRYSRVDVATTNQRVEVKLSVLGDGSGVVARYTDNSNHYYIQVNADGTSSVGKRVAGVNTTLGGAQTYAAGDRMALKVNGTTVTAYRNDIAYYTVTDSSLTTGNLCGLRSAFSTTAYRMDDFKVYDS